jgi:hypothetical protein
MADADAVRCVAAEVSVIADEALTTNLGDGTEGVASAR